MFCLHDWLPWGVPFRFSDSTYQNRRCTKCGKEQQRRVGYIECHHTSVCLTVPPEISRREWSEASQSIAPSTAESQQTQ